MVCLIRIVLMALARLKRRARRGEPVSRGPGERRFSRFSTYAACGTRLVQTQTADGDTAMFGDFTQSKGMNVKR